MSVCLECNGLLVVNKNKKEEFVKELSELAYSYNKDARVENKVKDTINFSLYARHFFMSAFEELAKKYISDIEGKVWFDRIEGDGSLDNPFPNAVYIEFVGGKMFDQTLWTRLSEDWEFFAQLEDSHTNEEEQEEKPIERKDEKNNNDDEFPF